MFVKQIDLKEALRMTAKGQEVMVMAPSTTEPKQWNDYHTDTLQGMLSGCMFFRQEPAMKTPAFDAAVQEMEAQNPISAGGKDAGASRGTTKPAGQRGGTGKRSPVDTGKILALHNAGWTNKAIAEEMKMSEKSVWYYIDKAKKGKTDEKD